jgi:hypothetical protein
VTVLVETNCEQPDVQSVRGVERSLKGYVDVLDDEVKR